MLRNKVTNLVAAGLFWAFAFLVPAQAQEVSPSDNQAIQSVITDQLSAFKTDQYDRAYSHAAPSIKKFFPSVDRFIGMVRRGYSPIFRSGSHSFARSQVRGSDIYQETIITDESGKTWQAIYSLRKMPDGTWKITGVQMNPYEGAST